MWELAFSAPLDPVECSEAVRTPEMDPYATDEVRCALSLTRRGADIQLSLADELVDRLPQVWEALHQGQIDLARARVICNGVAHLEPEEASQEVDSVIDQTGDLTTSQIGQRIRRRCIQVAPDAARRRYEDRGVRPPGREFPQRLRHRRHDRPPTPDRPVAAILRRVNDLARRLQGNDAHTLDQIRSDILMDLLEGRDRDDRSGKAGVEIRVDLATLLGLNEEPGEIPGWGPVIADVARRLVDDQPGRTMVGRGHRSREWAPGHHPRHPSPTYRRPATTRPGPQPRLRVPRVWGTRHQKPDRPHDEPREGRTHRGRESRPGMRSRPPRRQAHGRLGTRAAGPGHLCLDQPPRSPIRRPAAAALISFRLTAYVSENGVFARCTSAANR